MNKKHLSVVMAGAMLASSVAPVLAETTKSEISAAELGLLKKDLRELLESKKFHSTDKLAGESVYYITKGLTGEKCRSVDALNTLLKDLKAGDKLYVWSEGFRVDEKGNYFSTTKTEDSIVGKYTSADLYDVKTVKVEGTKLYNQIKDECWQVQSDGKYNEAAKYLVQKEHAYLVPEKTAVIEMDNNRQIVLTEGSEILDFSKPVDKDGYEVKFNENDLIDPSTRKAREYSSLSDELKNKVDSIVGFKSKTVKGEEGKDITDERIEEITITTGGNNVLVSDLYDGLMLTEKGHDLLSDIKYYDKVSGNKDKVTVNKVEKITGTDNYQFTIEFKTINALSEKTLIVTGTNKDDAKRLQKWLEERNAKVDILAGSNRYATAVKIAKEQVFEANKLGNSNLESNIVLVNGNALVDGLSAAPLAAKLGIHDQNTKMAAPVLLTESDKLPKETKSYLKELLDNKTINNLNTTIHLVGGTSILSKSLERELKGLGFDVERYGGANREETSLKVAEKINSDNVFVVGGNGEADAMSIAAVAANSKTPIVVAKNGGISEDAIEELKGANVTVVGGEQLISKADFESIKSEAKSINRVAGANRQATNALVIEKYYAGKFGDTQNVIVAKDGQHNKNELIDALAAANMASEKKAPVVLATNKLSKAQINALELNAKDADALYQVGHGVSRDVVKTIAQRLGLAN